MYVCMSSFFKYNNLVDGVPIPPIPGLSNLEMMGVPSFDQHKGLYI